jgi:hypothetical protein
MNLSSATNATISRTQAVATIINRIFRTISITGVSLAEGNSSYTNAMFRFTLSTTSAVPVSVQYHTANGTASGLADYAPVAGTLVFTPGVTNLMLAVPVFGNLAWSPDKTFYVQISQPQNAIIATNDALAIILNDDPIPALAILSPPMSQTVTQGAATFFAVTAIGNPTPLTFQWKFNGNNISGATNSTLNLTNIQSSSAGNYGVTVANAISFSTNRSAGLKVLSKLDHNLSANSLILTWSGNYTLQTATNVSGPYFDILTATSPYTNWINAEPRRFFRLRSAPANGVIATSVSTNGQFLVNNVGLPGYDYLLQASTNLTDWISIQTNAAPFQYIDPAATIFPMRFYRTLFLP